MTPVRSSSARAATMVATVVMTAWPPAPSPASAAPGRGPWRRPSPRRTGPWPVAAPTSYQCSSAATPSAPPVASAHRAGRPTSVARAPSANALTTSGHRRTPPSTYTSARPATSSTISARMSAVAGASASWRGPWFDTTTAVAPASMHRTASSARCTPLATTGSELSPASQRDVVGRERRLEFAGDHGHEPALAGAVGAVSGQVGQRQVVGQAHARPPFAQAEARNRCVDGEDERTVAVRRRLGSRAPPCATAPARCRPASSAARPAPRPPPPRAGTSRATRGSSVRRPRQHRGRWPPHRRGGPVPGSPWARSRPGNATGAGAAWWPSTPRRCPPPRADGAASGSRPPRCPRAGARRRPPRT